MGTQLNTFLENANKRVIDPEHKRKLLFNIGQYDKKVVIGKQQYSNLAAAKKKAGEPLKAGDPIISTVDQPRFFTMKTTTSISLRNGQYVLLATHKMMKPEGYVDVFIVHAGATMVK